MLPAFKINVSDDFLTVPTLDRFVIGGTIHAPNILVLVEVRSKSHLHSTVTFQCQRQALAISNASLMDTNGTRVHAISSNITMKLRTNGSCLNHCTVGLTSPNFSV